MSVKDAEVREDKGLPVNGRRIYKEPRINEATRGKTRGLSNLFVICCYNKK